MNSASALPFVLVLVSLTLVCWKLRRTPVNELVPVRLGRGDLQTTTMSWDFTIGGFLLVTCVACLLLLPHFVSTEGLWHPWTYLVLSCLVVSGLVFVWHQGKTQTRPLVDFGLISRSPYWQILLATGFREAANAGVSLPFGIAPLHHLTNAQLQFLIPWYSVAMGKEPLSRTSLMMALSIGVFAGGLVANACFVKWKAPKHIYIMLEIVCALAACMMYFRWRCK